MAHELVEVAKVKQVTTITLNRPAAMNALSKAMHQELQAAFDDFAAATDQRVCVVKGAGGRAFSAGSDIKAFTSSADFEWHPESGYAGIAERFDLAKPVIAAVDGICLGGGFELALACDIIVATEDSHFGLVEPRIGAVAIGGGVHRLVRQVGLKRAMGHLLAATPLSAREGYEMGFVTEVVAKDGIDAAVERWCEHILAGAPLAILATKEAAMLGLDEPSLADAIANQWSYPAFKTWLNAEDTMEGTRAFAEKRPQIWRGR